VTRFAPACIPARRLQPSFAPSPVAAGAALGRADARTGAAVGGEPHDAAAGGALHRRVFLHSQRGDLQGESARSGCNPSPCNTVGDRAGAAASCVAAAISRVAPTPLAWPWIARTLAQSATTVRNYLSNAISASRSPARWWVAGSLLGLPEPGGAVVPSSGEAVDHAPPACCACLAGQYCPEIPEPPCQVVALAGCCGEVAADEFLDPLKGGCGLPGRRRAPAQLDEGVGCLWLASGDGQPPPSQPGKQAVRWTAPPALIPSAICP
jgi:hypothetical protein